MSESLKQKTLRGTFWSFAERFTSQGIHFIVMIIIARSLSPREFGLIGMLAIFFAVSQSLIDSGFSQALIRKQDRTEIDKNTIFYFNIVVSVADEKNYFVENKQDNKYRILAINVCGHNVDIKIMDRNTGACADAVIKLERGFIRITITTYDNVDIKDYWLDNPISDSSYISIFEDLLSVILKGESKI